MLLAPHDAAIDLLKKRIKTEFEVDDAGPIHWILGIEAKRDLSTRTITLSQAAYIDSIVLRYGFKDAKPCATPMDPSLKLSKDMCATTVKQQQFMKDKPFAEALGAAQYLAVSTCPDIAYTCSQLAKYIQNPGPDHWRAVTRLYQYLKGTCDLKLHLGGTAEHTVGYSDADGMSTEGRKAISGYVYLINGGTVSWSSKQQDLVTLDYGIGICWFNARYKGSNLDSFVSHGSFRYA